VEQQGREKRWRRWTKKEEEVEVVEEEKEVEVEEEEEKEEEEMLPEGTDKATSETTDLQERERVRKIPLSSPWLSRQNI